MLQHTRRQLALTAVARVAAASLASPAAAQGRQADSTFRWSGRASAGQWIALRNLNGSIRVEQGSGDQIQVRAVKSWRRGDPAAVRVEVTRYGPNDRDLLVCAMWTENTVCNEREYRTRSSGRGNRDNDVSVQYIVTVPRGVNVRSETVNGSVDVSGATGEVIASSVNGNVRASSTGGPVEARAVNGNVYARMGSIASSEDLSYESVNGNVVVEFSGDLNADLEMSTVNGGFETNFPLTLQGRVNPKHLRATVGTGGRQLRLKTVNGNVELRRN